jgi:hypothetical protein
MKNQMKNWKGLNLVWAGLVDLSTRLELEMDSTQQIQLEEKMMV